MTRILDETWRNAFRLMRIPFSIYLMPMYWLALARAPSLDGLRAAGIFIHLHLLLFPTTNGYNSLCDRDDSPVGGLEKPPPVTAELGTLVLIFDALSVVTALLFGIPYAALVVIYLVGGKVYSHPGVRWKKRPFVSTLCVAIFQGGYTYLMVQIAMEGAVTSSIMHPTNLLLALLNSVMILGSYPLTQIYQHAQDEAHGDMTISRMLGVRGTFIFSTTVLVISAGAIVGLFLVEGSITSAVILLVAGGPVMLVLMQWLVAARRDASAVNHRNAMRMNAISSLSMSGAFVAMLVLRLI